MTASARLNLCAAARRGQRRLFAGALVLNLSTVNAIAQANPDVETGRVLAQENCARCHAVGVNGESPHDEAPPFRDVVQQWPPAHLAEALAEGIVVGHPEMPEFTFSESEIDALIAYLESLAGS
ncbi:MAG: cytochrome c [Pseudomonadota bacterium]